MIGSSVPVAGAETLTCRSTARLGADSTTGLNERTGVGALTTSLGVDSLMMLILFGGIPPAHKADGGDAGGNARFRLRRPECSSGAVRSVARAPKRWPGRPSQSMNLFETRGRTRLTRRVMTAAHITRALRQRPRRTRRSGRRRA